jgi:alpha-methylacyl-CoA racemase
MLLANLGATVLRLRRPSEASPLVLPGGGSVLRGRPAVEIDLKSQSDREIVNHLLQRADALIEGFRPGVMERLGFAPDTVHAINPRLVYGRVTGYGQTGPLASTAGHDINYLAVSGVLSALGRAGQPPTPPVNLLGDYGGGGMLLALGVVAGLIDARRSGHGSVVDAAMVDGVAQLATVIFGFAGAGGWGPAGTNALDTGAHFYEVYRTRDDKFVAVGAIEPQFYAELLDVLDVDPADYPQWDQARWPAFKRAFAKIFAVREREEWVAAAEGRDACLSPVLTLTEAPHHPHNRARKAFPVRLGTPTPAPAPRFSIDTAEHSVIDDDLKPTLATFGLSKTEIDQLAERTQPRPAR